MCIVHIKANHCRFKFACGLQVISFIPNTMTSNSNSNPNQSQQQQPNSEEEVAIWQSEVYGNGQLMMRMKKKEEEERERKGNEEEEEEEEEQEDANDSDNNTNNLTALNPNATKELSQVNVFYMSIINRMCTTLQSLATQPALRSNASWLSSSSIQLMSDFAFVKQHVIANNPSIDFNVYSHLIINFFNGIECSEEQCMSVEGMEAAAGTGEMATALRQMDSIHCTLMHAYQRRYKLYGKEREVVGRVEGDGDDDDDNHNNYSHDAQAECIRSMFNERRRGGGGSRRQAEEEHMKSKFVAVVDVGEQKRATVDGNCITMEMPW